MVPSIQRGYVWKRSQVPFLLDSLYRGYPIGALLIWRTNLDVPLRLADVVQGTPAHARPSVLLDGQQRLTSLAKVVEPATVRGGSLDVRFSLHDETFLNPSAVQRRDPMLVRVTEVLGEAPQFGELLKSAGIESSSADYDEYYTRLRQLHAIRDYQIPVITVDSDDYEEVAEIFARVNQGGRRLSKGDLVYSAIAARWSDGLKTIEAFTDDLNRANFALDREAVLRLTALLAGVGAHPIKLISKENTGDTLKNAWNQTEIALRYAVDFLSGECGIPRASVLTSPNVIVVPAYLLFHRNGNLSDDEARGLRRWVFAAMAFSHYSNQVESKLDTEARLIRDRSGQALFDELIRRASGPRSVDSPITPDDLLHKGAASPLFNLLYIAALRAGAKNWCSNTAISAMPMTSTSKIEYHHVFPKARVMQRFGRETTDSVANLAFISGACNRQISASYPSKYLPKVHPDRLGEQWIPSDPELWDLDRFHEFLQRRREAMARELNDLLGLPDYAAAQPDGLEAELPDDDDDIVDGDIEVDEVEPVTSELSNVVPPAPSSAPRPPQRRRDIGLHMLEVFANMPVGTILSVREIASYGSSQYQPDEVSQGAIAYRINAGCPDGLREVVGMTPLSVEKISDSPRDQVGSGE
ncbi:MAG TPA: DUF262 domain-containing protein [Mycobacteriales bacterium]|nr:DUF262 domain-containing protein [Mycobacteriales bacterium]